MIRRAVGAIIAATTLTSTGLAQQSTQAPPPVRQLGPIVAVTQDSLSSVAVAVQTSLGRVFVNDILAHRVLLYDSTLTKVTVVADSTGATANAYGNRPATLLPFRGDSVLLITPASLSMLVVSPEGKITRTMAMPPTGATGPLALIGNIFGNPAFDAKGRLAYYAPLNAQFRFTSQGGDSKPMVNEPPDSAFIVRFDFATRTLDTAGVLRIPRNRMTFNRPVDGKMGGISSTAFPPGTVDGWTVTSDGTIAVVRGRDYHVDWLGADGKWTATPRMPYTWEHLNDDQKNALLDSALNARQALIDSTMARVERARSGNTETATATAPPSKSADGAGGGGVIVIRSGSVEGDRGGGPPPSGALQMPRMTVTKADLSDVPDYRPPFGQGGVQADRSDNIWIRTSTIVGDRPVYDIVNREGEVVDRLQLPAHRLIAGFGPNTVYLSVRDSTGNVHMERARVK